MARSQTSSGGISQDPSLSYPIYVELSGSTSAVSAILNTGPSFIAPEGYSDWSTGIHIAVFPDGMEATAHIATDPLRIDTFIMGKEAVVFLGDVTVLMPTHIIYPVGLGMTIRTGQLHSTNWSRVSEEASTKEHWIKV